ncbi:MAG: hypothetical protein Q8O40_15750, partial [Chloroflexota bacterium]|nr:hypothetical protein [Chloroflexota bacterium]
LRNDTAGATVLVEQCDFALNDTAGFVVFSNVAGTWTLRGNYLSGTAGGYSVSLGTVRGFGNTITTTAAHAVTGGAVTEKSGRQTYVVFAGMIIQHAITAAAADTPAPAATAPYTVVLHPGSYTEAITPATFVNIVGVDRDSVVILQADADVVTIGAITTTLANVTIRLVTPLAARNLVAVSGAAARATLRNIRFEVTTPGGFTNILVSVSAAATVEIQDCFIVDYTGGAAAAAIGISLSAAGTVRVRNTDLTITNANAFAYSVTLAGAVMTLDGCRAAGTATDLRASAGILRVRNTQYRSAVRSATGVIIDESPYPALSALRVVGRLWPLALVANQNIATRLAIGGAATPGGTGQIRLRINDNAADAAGTEQAADAAGALASTWTPARGIRYVLPISVGAFRATTSMFFGVRGALGAAVPGVAEHHAGFIWTGAAFNASSSNGGGVGATTALTTPSTGVHHILEVIVVGGVQVEFYVDGLLVATHAAAAAVPTAVLFFQEYEISTGAGAATTSDITLREGFLEECVA